MIFIALLHNNLCSSQTKIAESAIGSKTNSISTDKNSLSVRPWHASAELPNVLKKSSLPQNQKNAPAVFYILNDTAVDYKTYINSMRNTKDKK